MNASAGREFVFQHEGTYPRCAATPGLADIGGLAQPRFPDRYSQSCTAGKLSALLSDPPGASEILEGGWGFMPLRTRKARPIPSNAGMAMARERS
jgi:hypothetical protein